MRSEDDRAFLQRLRTLIGRDCEFLGKRCRLVEVLADEGTLILETHESLPPIQTDQYGQAAYRANDIMQIPILSQDGTSFSEEILDLFACLSANRQESRPGAVR
jgi:hypothetical protein